MANKKPTSTKKNSISKTTTNYTKKAVKEAKKVAKHNPKAFLIILIVAVLVAVLGGGAYYFLVLRKNQSESTSQETSEHSHSESSSEQVITTEGMSIHFLELGNRYTGDSTYIKAGDTDILIDAGSRQSSAGTIKAYVDQYCTDGILEYVIATHAHQDHIAGFLGTTTVSGIFDSYKINTLIDFSQTKATSQLYNNYVAKREAKLESGDILHHYTALDCVEETSGAQKVYTIADSITMTILDQKYYHETSNDENDHSVCTLFSQGNNHYLFTGDLESKGETSLVELNPTLPHCVLFKGGHHGSPTSNTDALLNKITPDNVCICCCAGHDEYTYDPRTQFPSRDALTRILNHTENIYVTTVSPDGHSTYESMNGNITFRCEDGVNYTITGSNNSTKLVDTEWYETRKILWQQADEGDNT